MQYRMLGNTGIEVSVIGFGTEHLTDPRKAVVSVVSEAIDAGVNYFDLLFSAPEYREHYGAAFRGKRDAVVIAGHLGNAYVDGQSITTHDPALCETAFHDLLARLRIDAVDVLMLQFVDDPDDYARVTGPGGILEMARRFKEQGKARAIGMSSHMTPVSLDAVQSGLIEVLMFSINPAFDRMPGYLPRLDALLKAARPERETEAIHGPDARKALYHACRSRGVGVVVMKAYGAGYLLKPAQSHPLTPVHCLQYALDQPGVATVVPGMKNVEELRAALHFLDASPEERDYSAVLANSQWQMRGVCMYCNHCLPCPAGIDVADTLRLIDAARQGITPAIRQAYRQLATDASTCTACGSCADRCPFQVDVVAKMREGAAAFSSCGGRVIGSRG